MATLLHHIQPWMQKSITECEARLERKMQQFTKRKIDEVNQHLDAFELRVLARPAPPVDVSTLQAAVDSLRADIDTILEARVSEPVEPVEDTVLADLFATSELPPHSPRESAKRRRGRSEDEAQARKKERREIEAAKRASLAEAEAHQIRASQIAAGASSSRTVETAGGTTDGAVVAEDITEGVQIAEDTTEGVQLAEDVGSGKPDPPAC